MFFWKGQTLKLHAATRKGLSLSAVFGPRGVIAVSSFEGKPEANHPFWASPFGNKLKPEQCVQGNYTQALSIAEVHMADGYLGTAHVWSPCASIEFNQGYQSRSRR